MPKISTEWYITWTGEITFAALSKRLFEEGLGREDLIRLLEARSEELVTELCGPRYQQIPDCRYLRAGTKRRHLGTRFGRIQITMNRVYDTVINRTFVPLWRDIRIFPRRVYQDDISVISQNAAIIMTYRNTHEVLSQTVDGMPSPMTINNRVIEDGSSLAEEIHNRELIAETHQPDGTKLHSRSGGHMDVNMVIATSQGGCPRVRSITVGGSWDKHCTFLEKTKRIDAEGNIQPPNAVSDLEPGLADIMTQNGGYWQPCLVHVIRYTGIALWRDGMPMGEEKRKIVGRVRGLLKHLKNSLDCHLPRKEFDAIRHRITQTMKEFRRLATLLAGNGLNGTARFLREMSNAVTLYATLAMQGIMIPNNNNLLERLMGEVSKRCKHKWMSWTSRGAAALLSLLVMKCIEPETFQRFWNRKLYGALSQSHDLGICITRMEATI